MTVQARRNLTWHITGMYLPDFGCRNLTSALLFRSTSFFELAIAFRDFAPVDDIRALLTTNSPSHCLQQYIITTAQRVFHAGDGTAVLYSHRDYLENCCSAPITSLSPVPQGTKCRVPRTFTPGYKQLLQRYPIKGQYLQRVTTQAAN